ncbi:MAG TPA: polymer-forming cytoskeletal protein [Vicinamibacteria bacterium]|nr:polymer-forming cytoskeletal protein [Vicinamibacteria bacterium]
MDDDRETFLDRNAFFEGKLEGNNITLRGRFKGDLRAAGVLRIVDGSDIEASVDASRVEIDGHFQGKIQADSLQLFEQGRASGTFRAKTLMVREGAKLDGKLEIGEPAGGKH